MKISRLAISNLRAIRHFELTDLGSFVVIAGQNGSGKSCVFDAIRLLKSVYGGHQANEYHQWFGEFAINMQDPASLAKLFRSQVKPIEIEATISLGRDEREFIRENAERMASPLAYLEVVGQPIDYWTYSPAGFFGQLRPKQEELAGAIQRICGEITAGLAQESFDVALRISPNGQFNVETCAPIEAAFMAYEPAHLGLIEYHSASRSYARQPVGGIDLDQRAFEDRQRQSRLYNWQQKYQNIKTELASSYLRSLIAKEADGPAQGSDLNESLIELFQTFFPDKTYVGVHPLASGGLEFPVRLASGESHDIDELSSGEKEILYGYLKLRHSTPPHSVILLDEPELHLNPRLLRGFADFYYRRLGVENDNQIWLVTHSDTLLRQAVGNPNYRVFQMVPATVADSPENQAVEVLASDDVERVTLALVGDLAAYRPHGRVVILEGDSEVGFDVDIVQRLFPDFARRVNLVSGGHKARVRDLYKALNDAASSAGVRNRFFAIVDKDSDVARQGAATDVLAWDVYHIENYLLDAEAIRLAASTLLRNSPYQSDDEVLDTLRECASELVDRLVNQRIQDELNDLMIRAIAVGGNPDGEPGAVLAESVTSSGRRVSDLVAEWTAERLSSRAQALRQTYQQSLEDGTWIREFPGRLILRRFVGRSFDSKLETSLFMNAVLDKLVDLGRRPAGMQLVLDAIDHS